MKDYRAEQVIKYLVRYMHRGGRKFKRFKLDRRKFKKWVRQYERIMRNDSRR